MVASSTRALEEAHEMLSTKIRTAIIGLAATFSVAAAVGPTAPVASADYVRYHYQYCNDLHRQFEEAAEQWASSGGTDMKAYEEAVEDAYQGETHGCAWAGGSASRIKASAPPTSAGTLQVSTPEGVTVSPVRRVTSTSISALP
jgi:hypothetical protein